MQKAVVWEWRFKNKSRLEAEHLMAARRQEARGKHLEEAYGRAASSLLIVVAGTKTVCLLA